MEERRSSAYEASEAMLTGFVKAGKAPDLLEEIRTDLTIKQPVLLIDDPVVNWVAKGEQATIHARLSLPKMENKNRP